MISASSNIKINLKTMSAVASNNMERVASHSSTSSSGDSNTQTSNINGHDVLLGRGGLTNSHIGNKNFRLVVAEYQPEYLVARKREKKEIAKRIVDRIHSSGGRFLRKSPVSDVWSEVTYNKALEKTSQSLRESLDVRHKKFRPEKVIQPREGVEKNPRKRARLVKGLVMESPKLTGMSGPSNFSAAKPVPSNIARASSHRGADDIPDLEAEEGLGSASSKFEPFFNFYSLGTEQTQISEDDCGNVLEI